MAQCCRVRTNEGRVATLASSRESGPSYPSGQHGTHSAQILCSYGGSGLEDRFLCMVCTKNGTEVSITDVPLPIRAWMCVDEYVFDCACVCVCVVGESRKSCRRWGVEGPAVSLSVSLTRVYVVDAHTLLTADVAAPVEDAVTLLFAFLSPGVVAASAAQQVAALNAVRRHVADTIARPKGARLWVGLAEIGRALIVHQVALSGVLEEGVLDSQGLHPATRLAVLLHHHLWGAVVLVLQVVAQHAEVRLRPPARLHLTASRKAVTFAAQVHVIQDSLRTRKNPRIKVCAWENVFSLFQILQKMLDVANIIQIKTHIFKFIFNSLFKNVSDSSRNTFKCPGDYFPGLKGLILV